MFFSERLFKAHNLYIWITYDYGILKSVFSSNTINKILLEYFYSKVPKL